MRTQISAAIAWMKRLTTSTTRLLRTGLGVMGILLVLAGVMLLGVAGLSGCAQSVRLTAWEIPVSEMLRGCPGEKLPPENEVADVLELLTDAQVHSLRQTMALKNCEDKNKILLQLIEDHNRRVQELSVPWYRRLF